MRRAIAACALLACHDWEALSDHYDAATSPDASAASCTSRGPSLACPDAAIVCDGFESGSVNKGLWAEVQNTNATITVESSCVAFGSFAAHVAGAAFNATQFMRGDLQATPSIPDDVHVRGFFYVSKLPSDDLRLINLAQGSQNVLLKIGGGLVTVHDDFANGVDVTGASFSPDRWTCLELEVVRGNPGAVRAWIDGAPTIDSPLAVQPSPAFDRIDFGPLVNATQNQPAFDVWMDELVIAKSYIGCGP